MSRPNTDTQYPSAADVQSGFHRPVRASVANVLRPNTIKRRTPTPTYISERIVSEILAPVASQALLHRSLSHETHMLVCRCPFCACPVQGFRVLESRQVYEHILALEDEAAGLRAQLNRFGRRVSSAIVIVCHRQRWSFSSCHLDTHARATCKHEEWMSKVHLLVASPMLLVGLVRRSNTYGTT